MKNRLFLQSKISSNKGRKRKGGNMPERPLLTTSSATQHHSAEQGAWQIIPALPSPPPRHRDPTHRGMRGNRWIFHGKEPRLLLPVKHVSPAEPCVQNIKPTPFARTAAPGEGFWGYPQGNAPQPGTRQRFTGAHRRSLSPPFLCAQTTGFFLFQVLLVNEMEQW